MSIFTRDGTPASLFVIRCYENTGIDVFFEYFPLKNEDFYRFFFENCCFVLFLLKTIDYWLIFYRKSLVFISSPLKIIIFIDFLLIQFVGKSSKSQLTSWGIPPGRNAIRRAPRSRSSR